MVDIARLSISVDARQATTAADALNRLTATGGRAETQTRSTSAAYQRTSGTLAGLSRATQQTVSANTRAQSAYDTLGNTMRALQGNTAGAATSLMNLGTAATAVAQKTQAAGRGLGAAATAAGKAGTSIKGAGAHTANLAAQFNDIGVQLAAGQSPLILAVQQGTQINQVLAQMGQRGGTLKALGAAFTSIVSPVSLLTIGLIAGGAALAQWAIKAATAGRDTRSLADLTDDLRDSTDAYIQASDAAGDSIESLAEQYGTKLAPRMREIRQLQTEIEQGFAQIDLDAFSDAFERQITNPKLGGIIRNTFRGGLRDLFELGDAPQRLQHLLDGSLKRVRELSQEYDKAAGNANKQLPILDEIVAKLHLMSGSVNDRNEEELKLLDLVNQYREAAAENVAIELKTLEVKGERVKLSERDAKWAETTLERMRQQAAISQAVAAHGADSAQVVEQQAQATREVLDADIERRDITGELAQSLRDALESEIRSGALADDRIQQDQDLLDLKNKLKQDALDDLATAKQRQHAEASIAQRLANRIEMARAIVVHGKDSVQAKLAEEAVSRRLFELDLERQGITGDIRDQLIAQYEAAATLEGQIVAAQPAFQGLNTIIDSISKSWAEWVVRGFDDFKSFTKSVLDSFKQLLVQMIATAAKNRIMLSLGISGGLSGIAGAADGGGLLGGLIGGDGGGLGGLTKLLGPLSKLFGGGGGSGGGFFSSIGKFFGIGGGGGIAGGAGAVAAGGAVAGGAGGFGAFGLAGGAAGGAGAGAAAALGPIGLGIAGVLAIGGPLIYAALKTKTKILDSGMSIAIDGMDTLVKTFEDIEKSRFFGLSKKRSTRTSPVSERVSSPIEDAVDAFRDNIRAMTDVLGVGGKAIDDFSTGVTFSLHNLTKAQKQEKLNEALTEISNRMARAALHAVGFNTELENAHENLLAVVTTFTSVNSVLEALGRTPFDKGRMGVGRAVGLASESGGAEAFQQAASAFYNAFVPEAERMARLRGQLAEVFSEMNRGVPGTIKGFRDLVDAQNLLNPIQRRRFAQLLQIAPQFEKLIVYEQQLANERKEAGERAEAQLQAERAAAAAARQTFENRTQGMVQGLTDSPEQALARQRDELLAEAESLDAGTDSITRWYELQTQAIRDQVAAQQEAQQAASLAAAKAQEAQAEQARATFEGRSLAMVQRLTDSPEEALARQRDALLAEAEALGAGTNSIARWYKLQAQAIRDQATAQQEAEAEAARATAEAARAEAEAERATGAEQARRLFTPQADLMASVRDELTGAGAPLVGSEYLAELERLRDVDVERYDALLAYAPQLKQLIDFEKQLADEREAGIKRALEATREAIINEISQSVRSAQGAAQSVSGLTFGDAGPVGTGTSGLAQFRQVSAGATTRARQAQHQAQQAAEQATSARTRAEGHLRDAMKATTQEARESATTLARQAQSAAAEAAGQAARQAALAQAEQKLAVFADSVRHLNLNLDITSRTVRNFASSIVNLLGGVDDFQRRISSYYQNFFTKSEQLANVQSDLSLSFNNLNLAIPQTRQQFRDLVEAQDLSTRAGQETFASLIDLSDQFAFMTSEANKLNDVLGTSQQHFRSLREEAFVRSATPGITDSEDARQTSTSDPLFLELIRAINQGNVRVERELEDLRRETRRNNREPTRQTVT